ncbi:MAG: cupin domain-containing protein [Alphaproteobacteria bacterium]|nr:cupin domain-containing protein [Alphaproteobacteria bacterium]
MDRPVIAPRIVRAADAAPHPLHGEGTLFRLIYPATVGSRQLFVGLAVVPPGQAPHVFHRHGVEIVGNTRLEYAPDFEEFYFLVEGRGLMQWKDADGSIAEVEVAAGDAVFMPPGCAEHRIFNSGSATLRVLYGGTPPARVSRISPSTGEGN